MHHVKTYLLYDDLVYNNTVILKLRSEMIRRLDNNVRLSDGKRKIRGKQLVTHVVTSVQYSRIQKQFEE